MLQRLTFNGRRSWQAIARYVRYVQATVDLPEQGVDLFVAGAFFCTMQPGDELELSEPENDFEIVPKNAILSGVFAAGTSRLTPAAVSGEVDIDSGWRQSITGRQAVISMEHTAAAGQFPVIVLCPYAFPILGVVTVTVRSLLVTTGAAASAAVRILAGYPAPSIDSRPARQKRVSGAGTFGLELRSFDAASASPGSIGGAPVLFGELFRTRPIASDFEVIRGSSPLVLDDPAGNTCIAIIGGAAASSLIVNVAFEVANRA